MVCIGFILMDHFSSEVPIVPINLDMYHDADLYYRTDDKYKKFGEKYKSVAEEFHGNAIEDLDINTTFIQSK